VDKSNEFAVFIDGDETGSDVDHLFYIREILFVKICFMDLNHQSILKFVRAKWPASIGDPGQDLIRQISESRLLGINSVHSAFVC
jgi:hypothetical protein